MNGWQNKIAPILALIIGVMAVLGGGVMLGRDPGYSVVGWLPIWLTSRQAYSQHL